MKTSYRIIMVLKATFAVLIIMGAVFYTLFMLKAHGQTVRVFNIDTINGLYATYTNTYDDIYQYHESDWIIGETDSDKYGQWWMAFYMDNCAQPTVYVYYMIEELCYRMETYSDANTVLQAELIIKERQAQYGNFQR